MEFININAKATLEWLAEEDGVHNPQFNEHEEPGFEAINFLMDIQFNVESDSYIQHLDYTMMDDDEISDIVADYSDLI